MKLLIFSEIKQKQTGNGWFRGGEDLGYFPNSYRREHMSNYTKSYYTFSFVHQFVEEEDEVYFAYAQPYTYSNLVDYLNEIEKKKLNYLTRNTLC